MVSYSDKAHAIFPQTTVFVKIFFWICSDDNKCLDDNDKRVTMINTICYIKRLAIVDK